MWNKKGFELSATVVVELVLVLAVAFVAFNMVKSVTTEDASFQRVVVEDLRLMVNTLTAMPSNHIVVRYPQDVSPYTIVLSEGEVTLFTQPSQQDLGVSRTFILPQGYRGSGVYTGGDLCLAKEQHSIILGGCDELLT